MVKNCPKARRPAARPPPPPRNTDPEGTQSSDGMDTAPPLYTQESYADACRRKAREELAREWQAAREEKEADARAWDEALAEEQREIDRMVAARNRKRVPPLGHAVTTSRLRSRDPLLRRPTTQKRANQLLRHQLQSPLTLPSRSKIPG